MVTNSGSARPDRKTVEKNRRMHMKLLYARLNSLLPSSKVGVSLPLLELLDESVNLIKDLEKKVEQMKDTKRRIASSVRSKAGSVMKHLEFKQVDGRVGTTIMADERDWSVFYKFIEAIQEGGGEMISANATLVGDKVFCIIHSLVGRNNRQVGIETN